MTTLDLQDAYFHIPIIPLHRKYLRFIVRDDHYQFKALLLGISSALRVFTKTMVVVMAYLGSQGLSVFSYLDNWLLVADSRNLLLAHIQTMVALLGSLGIHINHPKSHLTPSQ